MRMWVYHRTEGAKIINSEEFPLFAMAGWADTPAAFAKNDMSGKLTESMPEKADEGENIKKEMAELNERLAKIDEEIKKQTTAAQETDPARKRGRRHKTWQQ